MEDKSRNDGYRGWEKWLSEREIEGKKKGDAVKEKFPPAWCKAQKKHLACRVGIEGFSRNRRRRCRCSIALARAG